MQHPHSGGRFYLGCAGVEKPRLGPVGRADIKIRGTLDEVDLQRQRVAGRESVAVNFREKVRRGTLNVEQVFARHPYTWALLSSMPQMGVKGEDLFNIQGTPPNLFTEIRGDAFAPRNPLALKIDFVKRPPYFDVSATHRAKTWLLDPRAPKIEPPAAVRMLQEEGK